MVEPRRVGRKAIGLPDFLGRKIVEGPEPLFRVQGRSAEAKADEGGANDSFSSTRLPAGRQIEVLRYLALRTSGNNRRPTGGVGQLSRTSFTSVASCFSENGFGRKPNLASAGRFLANASSA